MNSKFNNKESNDLPNRLRKIAKQQNVEFGTFKSPIKSKNRKVNKKKTNINTDKNHVFDHPTETYTTGADGSD